MGNAMSPCFQQNSIHNYSVKLIFYGGTTKIIKGKHIAGQIMFESPESMVCHADSFFIGHPIPILAIDDLLMPGQTYFVLPTHCFASNVLSASSFTALRSSPKLTPINFGDCPFQYLKGVNGRVLIKVVPEFITRLISRGRERDDDGSSSSFLCSTPELKKHYDQLVGSKDQVWSPKLETISEYKIRFSPCRFIGLQWKHKENHV
ncbi:DUF4228 domain-containing protein [Cephalotus follicularis]|uniref:DUF4228 domain-containing protein n=1 Tax=Cephalotus follicularis TaxID=3775 RepID=A0A1Q3B2B9_CEPFO|nr:DUF4228 domain-containing protein [Cephalotus follicularis]